MTLPKALSPQRPTSGVYERGESEWNSLPRVANSSGDRPSVVAGRDAPADHYDPESDVVAPLSLRASHTELLWVCGDCGHHYPRSQACPDGCSACGAPREHFYAPVED